MKDRETLNCRLIECTEELRELLNKRNESLSKKAHGKVVDVSRINELTRMIDNIKINLNQLDMRK